MKTSIIATGASLKGFDFTRIQGHIIAVNYAFKYVDYDMLVAIDNPKKYGFKVDERLYTHECWRKVLGDSCNYFKKKGCKGIDRREGYVTGYNNSLFAAINLALNMGFTEIEIYGADMCLTDGYSHFYSTEVVTAKERKVYDRVFHRCRSFKQSFEIQKEEWESITWMNPQPEQMFNGACLVES
jgi:hypothetical protein